MRKMLLYLLCIAVPSSLASFTVVIDPGHGGKYPGCIGAAGLMEKDVNLAVSLKILELLKNIKDTAITALITRSKDQHFGNYLKDDLAKRVEFARNAHANLFISIHFNSRSTKDRGFQVYVPMKSPLCVESYKAASCMHYMLSQGTEPKFAGNLGNLNECDGGIRAAKFIVLASAPCPALLIELDFLSNPQVEHKLKKDTQYTTKLAELVVEGVLLYMSQLTD